MKYMLNMEQFEKLLAYYQPLPESEQTDHYFDTLDFWFLSHGTVLRVREKNAAYIFQIKEDAECSVTKEQFEAMVYYGVFPEEIRRLLADRRWNKKIHYAGSAQTKRFMARRHGCEICLDQNRYLGKTDYALTITGAEEQMALCLREMREAPAKADFDAGEGEYQRFCRALLVDGGGYLIRNQVSCIPVFGDEYCLIRKNKPESSVHNMWIPAGGHIEYQESMDDACIREIREETGLIISNPRMMGVVTFRGGMEYHSICGFFTAEASDRQIVISENNIEARWFHLDELLRLENVTDYHREIYLQMLVHRKHFTYDLIEKGHQYVGNELKIF